MRELIENRSAFTTCYGCGRDNARGLGLVFYREDGAVVADFTPAPEHGGFGRILHGGVTASLCDEAFGWTIYGLLGKLGMTTEMTIAFKAPLICGKKSTVRARVERQAEKACVVRAEVFDHDGELAAEATGTMRFVSQRAVERLGSMSFE